MYNSRDEIESSMELVLILIVGAFSIRGHHIILGKLYAKGYQTLSLQHFLGEYMFRKRGTATHPST